MTTGRAERALRALVTFVVTTVVLLATAVAHAVATGDAEVTATLAELRLPRGHFDDELDAVVEEWRLQLLLGEAALRAVVTESDVSLAGVAATGLAVAVSTWRVDGARRRRPSDRIVSSARAVAVGLGTLGFAGYVGLALVPRGTVLLATGAALAVLLPVATTLVRREPDGGVLVVGDDAGKIADLVAALDRPPVGVVAPPSAVAGLSGVAGGDRRLRTDGGRNRDDEGRRADGSGRGMDDGATTVDDRGASASDVRPLAPTDGSAGRHAERVGGLCCLDRVVADSDVDTVALGFAAADREEFFGTLRTCLDSGVRVVVHASHGTSALVDDRDGGEGGLDDRDVDGSEDGDGRDGVDRPAGDDPGHAAGVLQRGDDTAGGTGHEPPAADWQEVDLEPVDDPDRDDAGEPRSDAGGQSREADPAVLDVALPALPWRQRLAKRCFDVCFALLGLLLAAPLLAAIAVAIKLDSRGPVLYGQERTGHLGEPFQLLKFRSMRVDAEADSGARLSDEDAGGVDPRVTRVGRVLRATHLDELPQLLSVLRGDMSVVGPRPERPELEAELLAQGLSWEKRWFVRPGLTGLAQVNRATGFEPGRKLALDLAYQRRQSLSLDVRIVAAQVRIVLEDAVDLLRGGDR